MALRTASAELTKAYWESVWEDLPIPAVHEPAHVPEYDAIFRRLPLEPGLRFLEVGCAPGKWMAYFARQFGLQVSGVEYADRAYEKTVQNLQCLGIPARVHLEDFLRFESDPYDVVFSAGFIEHFSDPTPIVGRLAALCKPGGLIVTMIPNMHGLNRWISRVFRPEVAAGHFPISLRRLVAMHESAGVGSLWADYSGGYHVLLPVDNNRFARKHPGVAGAVNFPFRAWNKLVQAATRRCGVYPKNRWICTGIVYAGRKGLDAGGSL